MQCLNVSLFKCINSETDEASKNFCVMLKTSQFPSEWTRKSEYDRAIHFHWDMKYE